MRKCLHALKFQSRAHTGCCDCMRAGCRRRHHEWRAAAFFSRLFEASLRLVRLSNKLYAHPIKIGCGATPGKKREIADGAMRHYTHNRCGSRAGARALLLLLHIAKSFASTRERERDIWFSWRTSATATQHRPTHSPAIPFHIKI